MHIDGIDLCHRRVLRAIRLSAVYGPINVSAKDRPFPSEILPFLSALRSAQQSNENRTARYRYPQPQFSKPHAGFLFKI
jgi:hypothetical protein